MFGRFKGMTGRLSNVLAIRPPMGLYRVRIHYKAEGDREDASEYIVKGRWALRQFLLATLQLHYTPGKNPHNNVEAAPAQIIVVQTLHKNGPYWWTVPGLMNNNDPRGACLYDWSPCADAVWVRPGVEIPDNWRYTR